MIVAWHASFASENWSRGVWKNLEIDNISATIFWVCHLHFAMTYGFHSCVIVHREYFAPLSDLCVTVTTLSPVGI